MTQYDMEVYTMVSHGIPLRCIELHGMDSLYLKKYGLYHRLMDKELKTTDLTITSLRSSIAILVFTHDWSQFELQPQTMCAIP